MATSPQPIKTSIFEHMYERMKRTHWRRRASVFVGPPGIGKSTAIEAFRAKYPQEVVVVSVLKRGITGPQALQQLLQALRTRNGNPATYITNATSQVQQQIAVEIEKVGGGLPRDTSPERFPLLTIVFDEAQRLTNGAIDALRDYNEPHYRCRGTFPLGLIFVGNNELSLKIASDGNSILDAGMGDRLRYSEHLTYDHVERQDIELYVRSLGVSDDGAVNAIVSAFYGPFGDQRSFRRINDLVEDLVDEALDEPITRDTVRAVLGTWV
ncbi:MAG: hypothetical protein C0472_03585 [Erythrobacter sp.]|nr:hypothetical protein [Erythrobacter sp.]MBA4173925.1 hypothetical protein [Hyphomicrobium sp.]